MSSIYKESNIGEKIPPCRISFDIVKNRDLAFPCCIGLHKCWEQFKAKTIKFVLK